MGNKLIPDSVAEDIIFQATRENIYRSMFPRPVHKPTRRERFRAWRNDWANRIALAVEALRGQHDCGDGYDW